jgi:HlyD family secretion protein
MSHRGWSPRAPLVLGWLALCALVVGFGTWAMGTQISGAIIAPGQVVVERNRQVVQHPEGGVVAKVMVRDGDRVAAGAVLMRLEDRALRSQLARVETRLFEVMARRARLEAERDGAARIAFDPRLRARAVRHPGLAGAMAGQRRLIEARAKSMDREQAQVRRRRAQTAKQIEGISAQEAALRRQLELIERELTDQTALWQRGLAPVARVLSLRREEARLRGTMGELAARRAAAADRAAEIELEGLKLRSRHREAAITELRELHPRELDLAEERRALRKRLSRLEVTAPVAGVVHDLQVFGPQAVVRPAAALLYIVPQDRPLVIQARIAPSDIDALHAGQKVNLRFSALHQGVTPNVPGRITHISADILQEAGSGPAYFRADIRLERNARADLPEGLTLLPGMPVEAFFKTGAQRPMAYLLKPLTDYFIRAFRE